MFELENVSYILRKNQILNQISFTLKEKDFCVLFGPEGSGKTLLFHILMGFVPKYQGNVKFFGKDIKQFYKKEYGKIRFVPEGVAWEENMTISHYINMIKSTSAHYNQEIHEKLWEDFQLPTGIKMLDMTYQQNKLIQILVTICAEPSILILDNPSCYLEEDIYQRVLHYLRIWTRTGKIVLLSSRSYQLSSNYANCYVYLKEGQLVSFGRIKRPDYRQKIITVDGGDYSYLNKMMDKCIAEEKRKRVYLYKGEMKNIPDILNTSGCRDCTIEELTMEEELEEDYSGWE